MSREVKFACVACAIVLVCWAGSGVILFCYDERGTFGDMFGAVNSLFSGFAFVGVFYTLLLQTAELKRQRERAAESERDIRRTAELQELTTRSARLQSESTERFYQLQALIAALQAVETRLRDPELSKDENYQNRIYLQRKKVDLEDRLTQVIDSAAKPQS